MPRNVDRDARNEDWLKTMVWDLGHLTVDELMNLLGWPDKTAVRRSLRLPFAEAMPPETRQAVNERLTG